MHSHFYLHTHIVLMCDENALMALGAARFIIVLLFIEILFIMGRRAIINKIDWFIDEKF